MNKPVLSIVATIYNVEKIICQFIDEVLKYVIPLNITYEIILVNDGSIDNSENEIQNICKNNNTVKCISLSRNFGQQVAASAGINYSSGEYIIIMDGDFQNPPSEIPLLYNKIREGYDIIYCSSKIRNNLRDRITSEIFWFILVKLLKVKIIKNQLMMKIMTRKFVNEFNRYNEINRTISGIVNDIGLKYDIVEIKTSKRLAGKSNYTFFKRFNLMIDVIISLSNAPLNFLIYLGLLIFILTCCTSVFYFFRYLFYDIVPGFTSMVLLTLFFGSVIILMLGLIGRYLSNIYSEIRRRPLYIIQKEYNFTKE